jgi:hypothetical protein
VPPAGQQGDAFAQAPEGGTAAAESYNPAMFGDQGGFSSFFAGQFSTFSTFNTISSPSSSSSNNRLATFATVASKASFKISENESPVPVNRAYINYNYYNNVTHGDTGITGSDVHRETLGLEQTIAEGAASLGFRIPFAQLTGSNGFDDTQFGDIDLIFKYAVYGDRRSGDVISTGMVLTLPTASKDIAIAGQSSLNPTILQPYLGYYFTSGDFYLHGFSSVAVPTDSRDVTLLFNDIGVGYWMYRDNGGDSLLRAVVPTFETHINTPLSHRGSNNLNPIGYQDVVDLSLGAHAVFSRSVLGVAVVAPVTGPKPYDFEVIANLNFHW